MSEAICRQVGSHFWIPDDDTRPGESEAIQRHGKKVCQRCPVISECLEFALEMTDIEPYGVWGGTTQVERRQMRQGRSNARSAERTGTRFW